MQVNQVMPFLKKVNIFKVETGEFSSIRQIKTALDSQGIKWRQTWSRLIIEEGLVPQTGENTIVVCSVGDLNFQMSAPYKKVCMTAQKVYGLRPVPLETGLVWRINYVDQPFGHIRLAMNPLTPPGFQLNNGEKEFVLRLSSGEDGLSLFADTIERMRLGVKNKMAFSASAELAEIISQKNNM